jgi:hypothetical protein
MAEIGQVYGSNVQLRLAAAARNVRVQSVPTSSRPGESTGAPTGMKLPPEQALREVARGVTDYIATNRLTGDGGYRAFKAEFVSDIPEDMLAEDEVRLIEKLSQELLDQMANDPLKNTMNNRSSVASTLSGQAPLADTNKTLGSASLIDAAVNDGNEGPAQLSGMTVPATAKAAALGAESNLILPGKDETLGLTITEAASTREEPIAMTWATANGAAVPGSTVAHDGEDLPIQQIFTRGLPGGAFDSHDTPAITTSLADRSGILNLFGDSENLSVSESPEVTPIFVGALQQSEASGLSVASLQGHPSALLRVDLKEILGGKMAELHIRHDEALIIGRVAVLLEQVNGLARLYEEQERTLANSRQKPLSTIDPALRQFLAVALGIVVDGNKVLTTPFSVGVTKGDDGLLVLDPGLLRSALESNRDEAVTVLKSMANSLYESINIYVDPRLLSRFSELLGAGATDETDRSRKETERRCKKEKDSLEKRFLEVTLILEESGKLRDWLMNVVISFGPGVGNEEARDEVTRRPLPAVDLAGDKEELAVFNEGGQLPQEIMTLFVACTGRALEEEIDTSIKLLLKRKSLSDKILADTPVLEPRTAMVCLANEELIIEKIETERRKLFESLDELARTSVAARTYRPLFPWPPPMAAFVASEG